MYSVIQIRNLKCQVGPLIHYIQSVHKSCPSYFKNVQKMCPWLLNLTITEVHAFINFASKLVSVFLDSFTFDDQTSATTPWSFSKV